MILSIIIVIAIALGYYFIAKAIRGILRRKLTPEERAYISDIQKELTRRKNLTQKQRK